MIGADRRPMDLAEAPVRSLADRGPVSVQIDRLVLDGPQTTRERDEFVRALDQELARMWHEAAAIRVGRGTAVAAETRRVAPLSGPADSTGLARQVARELFGLLVEVTR